MSDRTIARWVCVHCAAFVAARLVEADPNRPGCFKGHTRFEGHRFDAVLETFTIAARPHQQLLPVPWRKIRRPAVTT